jgi:hypothetical protein
MLAHAKARISGRNSEELFADSINIVFMYFSTTLAVHWNSRDLIFSYLNLEVKQKILSQFYFFLFTFLPFFRHDI